MTQASFRVERMMRAVCAGFVMLAACHVVQAQTTAKPSEGTSEKGGASKADDAKSKSEAEKSSNKKAKEASAASKNGRAVSAANKFKQECPCDSCKGKGILERSKKVDNRDGLRGGGARFATTRQEKRRVRCTACGGNRLSSTKVLRGAGERLAEALAGVDTSDQKWIDSQRALVKQYVNDVAKWGFNNLSVRLNESATSVFADNHTPKAGKPIVLVGRLASDDRNGNNHRVVIDFVGDRHIILDSPIIFDATEGQNVLVVASYKSGAGSSTIELEKGVVMTAYDDEALDLDEGEEDQQENQPAQGGRRGK